MVVQRSASLEGQQGLPLSLYKRQQFALSSMKFYLKLKMINQGIRKITRILQSCRMHLSKAKQ